MFYLNYSIIYFKFLYNLIILVIFLIFFFIIFTYKANSGQIEFSFWHLKVF